MSNLLNTASTLMCPHLGTVTAGTTNARVMAAGDPVVRSTDTFSIAGCTFMIGTDPHPCVRVEWVTPNAQSSAEGDPTLSESSVGFCVAADDVVQGTVMVVETQTEVAGV